MPRPRSCTDSAILEAVGRAISRVGPRGLRLQDVADEVGLAPSTLLQRFGSKRALLVAFARHDAGVAEAPFRRRKSDTNPLERVERGLLDGIADFESPEALAHHLTRSRMDLTDPELHADAQAHARRRRRAVRRLLDAAVDEGRLRPETDTRALSRSLLVTREGALATWALFRQKSLKRWVRRELRATLAPHLPA